MTRQFALRRKLTRSRGGRRKHVHWLDRAEPSFPNCVIDDTKKTLRMLSLYVPLSMFWSLFDQQVNGYEMNCKRAPRTFCISTF
jgi:hypothetical protein